MIPNPGTFRERATLQNQPSPDALDPDGNYDDTWIDAAHIRCRLDPVSELEAFRHSQIEIRATHRIIAYYRDDITVFSRFLIDGTLYYVTRRLDLHNEHRFHELYVEARNA